ncbi:hypothetical protein T439DRAFT_325919 [Meredithblackwellia eburnea MCA 4105]
MLGYISAWAGMGFGVRCYALALQKRNIFENFGGHLFSVGAFSGLGYYFYNLDIRQKALLADKKDQLIRMREREATLAPADDGSHGHH